MLRRPLAVLATALAAAAAVTVPLAGTAEAAGSCIFTPPARIAIYQKLTILLTDIEGACRASGFGYWGTSGTGSQASAQYQGSDAELYVPDDIASLGVRQWVGQGACTDQATCLGERGYNLTQNKAYTDIRLGAYGAIAGTRNSATRVTFTVTSAVWSGGAHRLLNRPMRGELQTQYADGTWHKVGNSITTASDGKATFAVSLPQRTWRFGVYSTARSFDRVSTPITR